MTCVYAPVSGTIACFDDLRQAFEDFKELLCEAFGWRRHQKRKIICKKCPCRNRLPDRRMTGYRIPQLRPDPHPHLPRDRLNKKHSPARGFCYTLALRDEAERRNVLFSAQTLFGGM